MPARKPNACSFSACLYCCKSPGEVSWGQRSSQGAGRGAGWSPHGVLTMLTAVEPHSLRTPGVAHKDVEGETGSAGRSREASEGLFWPQMEVGSPWVFLVRLWVGEGYNRVTTLKSIHSALVCMFIHQNLLKMDALAMGTHLPKLCVCVVRGPSRRTQKWMSPHSTGVENLS